VTSDNEPFIVSFEKGVAGSHRRERGVGQRRPSPAAPAHGRQRPRADRALRRRERGRSGASAAAPAGKKNRGGKRRCSSARERAHSASRECARLFPRFRGIPCRAELGGARAERLEEIRREREIAEPLRTRNHDRGGGRVTSMAR
jgi:hypothetical protein